MLKINTFAALGLMAALLGSPLASFAADNDGMMMAPKDAMMAKDSMHKDAMMMTNQKAYSAEAFKDAAATGKPFVVAFHKKGCALCAASVFTRPSRSMTKITTCLSLLIQVIQRRALSAAILLFC